jgi:5'-nucleotidase
MKKRIYVDMDGVLVDFQSGVDRLTKEEYEKYDGHFDDCPGIFSRMDPLPNAIESFKQLANDERFDVYILSTASWNNCTAWSDKLLWVQKYLLPEAYKRLTLSHHKNLLDGTLIIDDRTANGVSDFDGIHLQFGSEKFPDWSSIMDEISRLFDKN